jgi:hypothetical protein
MVRVVADADSSSTCSRQLGITDVSEAQKILYRLFTWMSLTLRMSVREIVMQNHDVEDDAESEGVCMRLCDGML